MSAGARRGPQQYAGVRNRTTISFRGFSGSEWSPAESCAPLRTPADTRDDPENVRVNIGLRDIFWGRFGRPQESAGVRGRAKIGGLRTKNIRRFHSAPLGSPFCSFETNKMGSLVVRFGRDVCFDVCFSFVNRQLFCSDGV